MMIKEKITKKIKKKKKIKNIPEVSFTSVLLGLLEIKLIFNLWASRSFVLLALKSFSYDLDQIHLHVMLFFSILLCVTSRCKVSCK